MDDIIGSANIHNIAAKLLKDLDKTSIENIEKRQSNAKEIMQRIEEQKSLINSFKVRPEKTKSELEKEISEVGEKVGKLETEVKRLMEKQREYSRFNSKGRGERNTIQKRLKEKNDKLDDLRAKERFLSSRKAFIEGFSEIPVRHIEHIIKFHNQAEEYMKQVHSLLEHTKKTKVEGRKFHKNVIEHSKRGTRKNLEAMKMHMV